jgi:arginine exporter protein ArgO
VLASTARLLIVAIGGVGLMMAQAPAWTLFALIGGAMVVFGLSTAASVAFVRWDK